MVDFTHLLRIRVFIFYLFFLQDLGNSDLNRDLFVVAHVMRVGKMLHSESGKKLTATLSSSSQSSGCTFRRPFGVGVLNIGSELVALMSNGTDAEEKEYSFKVFQCEDKEFFQLHEYIIRKQTSKYSPLAAQQHYGNYRPGLRILKSSGGVFADPFFQRGKLDRKGL